MNERRVDLILFAGQSNMAGRGVTCARWPEGAPAVQAGAGWEFRAVTCPDRLFPLAEPFGADENRPDGIHEVIRKTGSLASAFVNAYYQGTGVPVAAVSASRGGSVIAEWQPGSAYLTDALSRLRSARDWLTRSGYTIRRTFVLWCQGESDADEKTSRADYFSRFGAMLREMLAAGAERLLMIRIGRCNVPDDPDRYNAMIAWQDEIAETFPGVTMVARGFAGMRGRGLMKDEYHYYQAAYNEVGREAGTNAAAEAMPAAEEVRGCGGAADEAAVRRKYDRLTRLLISRGLTVTTMESCTAGQIASLITDTEGASAVLRGAFVTYANEAKVRQGVPAETIAAYGVYSVQTAQAMALACRGAYAADFGVGVTGSFGNADPNNADSVPGEVFFALADDAGVARCHCAVPPQPSRLSYKLYMADVIADRLLRALGAG